jgi:hypothetical protein
MFQTENHPNPSREIIHTPAIALELVVRFPRIAPRTAVNVVSRRTNVTGIIGGKRKNRLTRK